MNSANEGPAKVKPLSSTLRLFFFLGFLWSAMVSTWARDPDRVGVLALDAQQRASSVKAAPSGKDVPLVVAPIAPVAAAVPVIPPEPSAVQEKANEALVTVSLEERIQKQALQSELKQFGYELFSNTSATFSPSETLPVPPDYVIAPGDTFVVQVFGATDLEYRLVVTRDGRILVPEIGEISVSGLTFDASKSIIQQRISRIRIGVKTVVTLADLHTIQIVVMGEVLKPGSYNVGGMTTLFNALVGTGGIKTTGSLRKIELRRDNELVARMDLYDVLLSGRTKNNLFLRQGDVIFVPPLGPTVSVAGEVNRPAIYELLQPLPLKSMLEMAGGVLSTADLSKTQLRRLKDGIGYTLVQADLTKGGTIQYVQNGDQVRVFPVVNRMENVVLLEGNVITPGGYEWKSGMRVSDLIKNVKALGQRTDFRMAAVVRERPFSRRLTVRYFDLGKALDSPWSQDDLVLQPRDEVMVFDMNTARDNRFAQTVQALRLQESVEEPAEIAEIKGFVRHGGVFPLQAGQRLLDMIRVTGGVLDGADLTYTMLIRRTPLSKRIEAVQLSLAKALAEPLGDHNPLLSPGDRVYVFDSQSNRSAMLSTEVNTLIQQAGYDQPAPVVQITGKVRQAGEYPLTPGMTAKDLIDAAGGLTEDAYGQSAVITHQVQNAEEFMRAEHEELALIGQNELIAGSTLRLKPRDRLTIREKPESENLKRSVTLKGEVRFPGNYAINKRETMCEVVRRAGGFTQDAYVFGTVFTRESVRKREQEAIDKIFTNYDSLLAELHMSNSVDNDKKRPNQQGATDISNVLKGLKPPQAVGRMVVDMDRAVKKCSEGSDLVLEDGDAVNVPKMQDEVSVVGQVYQSMSHKFRPDRGAMDYINLSGGTKELAAREHAFVIQANGEVISLRGKMSSWSWFSGPSNISVTPGSTVIVPLTVDRINGREYAQSWVDIIYKTAVSAASMKLILGF
jgi:polysaccharide biosynthesis/export protein